MNPNTAFSPAPETHAPWSAPTSGPTQGRRLVRNSHTGWLGGVCSGLADYSGLDANLIRLLMVLGTVFGFGSLVLVYVAAWLFMPEA